MKTKSSRRNFLGSVAILSAGAVLGNVTKLFASAEEKINYREHWELFCTLYGARKLSFSKEIGNGLPACAGHEYVDGTPVIFEKESLMALPTYICFNGSKPLDVVVSFFDAKSLKKIFRINGFELQGLCSLQTEGESSMLEIFKNERSNKTPGTTQLTLKTVIRSPGKVKVLTRFKGNQQSFYFKIA